MQADRHADRQAGNKADGRYATYLENTDFDVAVATHAKSTHTNTVVFMLTGSLCGRLFKSEVKNHCQLPITLYIMGVTTRLCRMVSGQTRGVTTLYAIYSSFDLLLHAHRMDENQT